MKHYKIMAFIPDQGTQEVRGVALGEVGRVIEQLLAQGIERVVVSTEAPVGEPGDAG